MRGWTAIERGRGGGRAVRAYGAACVTIAGLASSGCTMDFGAFRRDGAVVERDAPEDATSTDVPEGRDAVSPLDAAHDASPDASPDAALDAHADAGLDAPADTPRDAPMDAGMDAACTPALVVNEVQTSGAGGGFDEFVEIYNAGSCAVALAGFTVRYRSAAGVTESTYWTGTAADMIASHAYFVLSGSAFRDASASMGALTGGFADPGGSVGIFSSTGTRIDSMGYGTAMGPLVEMQPAAAESSGSSIARIPNGADSNNNMTDFQVRSPPTPGRPNS